ncbi:MAG: hypothetical protein HY300_06525 [Verrucomicrobia bacterium]|nr:hypothetical protein [Verrucomicrobiota bacterium]
MSAHEECLDCSSMASELIERGPDHWLEDVGLPQEAKVAGVRGFGRVFGVGAVERVAGFGFGRTGWLRN